MTPEDVRIIFWIGLAVYVIGFRITWYVVKRFKYHPSFDDEGGCFFASLFWPTIVCILACVLIVKIINLLIWRPTECLLDRIFNKPKPKPVSEVKFK